MEHRAEHRCEHATHDRAESALHRLERRRPGVWLQDDHDRDGYPISPREVEHTGEPHGDRGDDPHTKRMAQHERVVANH